MLILINHFKDQLNFLYPSNSSTVTSIINCSNIANLVINIQQNEVKKSESETPIQNIELIEILLNCLREVDNQAFQYELLKMFEHQLQNNNIDKILESNFLIWCYEFFYGQDTKKQSQIDPNVKIDFSCNDQMALTKQINLNKAHFQLYNLITNIFFFDI